ncbi:MAG: hypothetical protein HQL07_03035 [Nitrospirae bacterium]|nr:hypothetical protein [Magnetococcales bacterium]
MTEIDRIERLKRKMVSIWAWCGTHKGDVRQQEATRIQDEQAWNQQASDLQARLLRYTENGSPTLEELVEGPKGEELVWLAALDRVLWGHHLDLAGDRELSTMVSHEGEGVDGVPASSSFGSDRSSKTSRSYS